MLIPPKKGKKIIVRYLLNKTLKKSYNNEIKFIRYCG